MSFIFRKATLDDIGQLNSLIEISSKSINSSFYTKKQIEAALKSAWTVDPQLIIDNTFWVAQTIKDEIVGCGGWSKHRTLFGKTNTKEGLKKLNPIKDAAKIRAIFVHPDYTRQGIGSALMDRCENEAKDFGFDTLELVSTLSGEKLYTARGYTTIKKYNADLVGGITNEVILMSKKI